MKLSLSNACNYNLFLQMRKSGERGRTKRERHITLRPETIQKLMNRSFINFDRARFTSINIKGFVSRSHLPLLEIDKQIFFEYSRDLMSTKMHIPSEEIMFSEDFSIIDNLSDFLPKPVKRVNLKIKNIKNDIPFDGDSPILYDD